MRNQLWQVFRTYITRKEYWFFVICMMPMILTTITSKNTPADSSRPYVGIFFFDMMVGMVIGMQLKIQYANPRAKLFPSFNIAHLIIPAILISLAILKVLVLKYIINTYNLATFGIELIILAAYAWSAYSLSQVWSIPTFVFMFGMISKPEYFIKPFLTAGPFAALIMIGLGLLGLVTLAIRLLTLNEEMPDYARVMPSSWWDFKSRSAKRDRGRLEAQAISRSKVNAWLMDVMFKIVFRNRTTANPPKRIILQQLSFGFSSLRIGLMILISFILFITSFQTFAGNNKIGNISPSCGMITFFSITMACNMISGLYFYNWPHFIHEALYPATRQEFASGLIHNVGLDMLIAAIEISLAISLMAALLPDQALFGSIFPPFYFVMLIAQFFLLGWATLWIASYRSFIKLIIINAFLTGLSTSLVLCVVFIDNWLLSASVILITILGIVGFYKLAYRRLCSMDLD